MCYHQNPVLYSEPLSMRLRSYVAIRTKPSPNTVPFCPAFLPSSLSHPALFVLTLFSHLHLPPPFPSPLSFSLPNFFLLFFSLQDILTSPYSPFPSPPPPENSDEQAKTSSPLKTAGKAAAFTSSSPAAGVCRAFLF